ncbi:clan AA aspartic protease [Sulfolobus acidocaldarius]|uniref:Conserved protein n=4 Tax=Sulfolobus acidocaldarius TaxID=2285 RepID=Q4J7N3_SULAC|nr:clan AA aspartic protease [Sulfolobus acidocaldarius]AAY81198.1 conserved protein [Sulfolobus acidocaldarius DSM 639]AGE71818.1 hypothetical protein SacN8_09290 [Sulfolobus acidocaldarius N8]AGE74089.1 hypothetical protein SacRon12I_09310 [Sulfolobus acidocaldarius Ron12/I]ALU29988.1 hypothetical protein ATY89_08625 [Sulfolobus acidocaldarius]ALU30678.1 hypothetical protein ATZ20_00035 [Sulfolobus acidocaldarius]
MNLDLNLNGINVSFKIDTGFDGECLLPHDIFSKIGGYEYDGPPVSLSDGRGYLTRAKIVEVVFNGKNLILECISVVYINKTLLGERALSKLGILIDYKNQGVKDP